MDMGGSRIKEQLVEGSVPFAMHWDFLSAFYMFDPFQPIWKNFWEEPTFWKDCIESAIGYIW